MKRFLLINAPKSLTLNFEYTFDKEMIILNKKKRVVQHTILATDSLGYEVVETYSAAENRLQRIISKVRWDLPEQSRSS